MPVKITIKSKQTTDGLNDIAKDLQGQKFRRDMLRATLFVLRDSKKNAPVDTGRLRSSIQSSIRRKTIFGRGVVGVVGSNVEYAPFMELGTKHTKMPPIQALEGWARRHGMNTFVVAQAILKRGGLKPRHYLLNALIKNEAKIVNALGKSVTAIIRTNGF